MEDKIIKEYLIDASRLKIKDCNPQTAIEFTHKYIDRLIDYPDLAHLDATVDHKHIRDWSIAQIQRAFTNRQVTMEELINAYHRQKQIQRNSHNSLTWSMYEEPLQRALELDRELGRFPDPASFLEEYPLAGFVISLKDSFYLRNSPSTSGMFINLDRVATRDPEMFAFLKRKGAVISCRGNIPQFLLSLEANNNLFGNTLHPSDPTRTAGGSTGGDPVNMLLGFANIAIGSDIGGSLRAPALYCGLYSLKPSNYRVSQQGMSLLFERRFGSDQIEAEIENAFSSQMLLKVSIGPIARSAHDIDRFMSVICGNQQFDNLVTPHPWNLRPKFARRVGVFRKLSLVEPSAACSRGLDEALERLAKEGYSFVEMDLNELFEECLKWTMMCFNKSPYVMKIFSGDVDIREQLSPIHYKNSILARMPPLMLKAVKFLKRSTRLGTLLGYFLDADNFSQADIFAACSRLYGQLMAKMKAAGVDALLLPGFPTVAPKLCTSNTILGCYMIVFNFLRMPAGICPITTVRPDEQFYESRHKDMITKDLEKAMQGSKGLPIGVQIAGRAYQDEVVVSIMKDLEKHFPRQV